MGKWSQDISYIHLCQISLIKIIRLLVFTAAYIYVQIKLVFLQKPRFWINRKALKIFISYHFTVRKNCKILNHYFKWDQKWTVDKLTNRFILGPSQFYLCTTLMGESTNKYYNCFIGKDIYLYYFNLLKLEIIFTNFIYHSRVLRWLTWKIDHYLRQFFEPKSAHMRVLEWGGGWGAMVKSGNT